MSVSFFFDRARCVNGAVYPIPLERITPGAGWADPGAVEYLYENVSETVYLNVRNCHPRDFIEQVVSLAKYKGIPAILDRPLLDRACQTYVFVEEEATNDSAGQDA